MFTKAGQIRVPRICLHFINFDRHCALLNIFFVDMKEKIKKYHIAISSVNALSDCLSACRVQEAKGREKLRNSIVIYK